MIHFRIPKAYHKGFEEFIKLTEEQRNSVINQIKTAPVGISADKFAQILVKNLKFDPDLSFELSQMLFSVYRAFDSSKLGVDEFVNRLVTALNEIKLEHSPNFQNQLKELLLLQNDFYFTNKADELKTEREKLLTNSRVITDIRPIFSREPECDLKSYLIIQTLKIEYIDFDRNQKEIFLALDNEDLKKLAESIQRALKKYDQIKSNMEKTNIKLIED